MPVAPGTLLPWRDSGSEPLRVVCWNVNGLRAFIQRCRAERGRAGAAAAAARRHASDTEILFEAFATRFFHDADADAAPLPADVVCLQETKLRADQLDPMLAVLEHADYDYCYEGYFSFCVGSDKAARQSGVASSSPSSSSVGYSGVATFVRVPRVRVLRAEEGVTGRLRAHCLAWPGNASSRAIAAAAAAAAANGSAAAARTSDNSSKRDRTPSAVPCSSPPIRWLDVRDTPLSVGGHGARRVHVEQHADADDSAQLDVEGRCVIVDLGDFVLLNVYAPNAPSEHRLRYKQQFLRALRARCRRLIMDERRAVVLAGDLNIAHRRIDHCDPRGAELEASPKSFPNMFADFPQGVPFEAHPSRRWLDTMLAPLSADDGDTDRGCAFVDAFRACWPARERAYTCWNVKTGARATNFGTRIDYILVADAAANGGARDASARRRVTHCDILPAVHGSDHCPVVAELAFDLAGSANASPCAPPLCAKNMFPRRQRSLRTMFSRGARPTPQATEGAAGAEKATTATAMAPLSARDGRGASADKRHYRRGVGVRRQGTLNSFRRPPQRHLQRASSSSSRTGCAAADSGRYRESDKRGSDSVAAFMAVSTAAQQRQQREDAASYARRYRNRLCRGHGEPCVRRVVKRADSKHCGRAFYVCARPPGAPDDARASCNHFEWAATEHE